MKLSELNPLFLSEFHFPYGEEKNSFILKYKEVVCFKIEENDCYVLLRGKRKLFGLKFLFKSNHIKRIKEREFIRFFIEKKQVVMNKKEYNIFKKICLINCLK